MENFEPVFKSLKEEAKALGYKVFPTTTRTEIDPTYKIIRIKYYVKTEENLFCFCHELGHAKEKNPNLTLYRKRKMYRIYSEVRAWVLGYEFVRKYELNKGDYWKSAWSHLHTYLRKRRG